MGVRLATSPASPVRTTQSRKEQTLDLHDYLITTPPAQVRIRLLRLLDMPHRGGYEAFALAWYLHADIGKLMCCDRYFTHCGTCGATLRTPLARNRGYGNDCWELLPAELRERITRRVSGLTSVVR